MPRAIIYVVVLVQLTGLNGMPLLLNPAEVSTLRAAGDEGHVERGARCVVVMTNGRQNAIKEDCPTAERIIDGTPCTTVCAGSVGTGNAPGR